MYEYKSKVYIQTDEQNRIIRCEGGYTTPQDLTGWTQIDEGTGDRYHHAQGNYFDKPIMTSEGIYRYKLVDGVVVEKTNVEIAFEVSAIIETVEPDPDAELASAISAATTIAGLKDALLGKYGAAKVKAERK